MAFRLQLDNGKIKEYCTYMASYGPDPGLGGGYYTRCGLHTEKRPENGACDHLNCAIHVAKDKTIWPLASIILFPCIMIGLEWLVTKNLAESVNEFAGLGVLMVILFIPFALLNFKRWWELTEFKNRGTIYGIKGHKL
jgi:hypothetical protein